MRGNQQEKRIRQGWLYRGWGCWVQKNNGGRLPGKWGEWKVRWGTLSCADIACGKATGEGMKVCWGTLRYTLGLLQKEWGLKVLWGMQAGRCRSSMGESCKGRKENRKQAKVSACVQFCLRFQAHLLFCFSMASLHFCNSPRVLGNKNTIVYYCHIWMTFHGLPLRHFLWGKFGDFGMSEVSSTKI